MTVFPPTRPLLSDLFLIAMTAPAVTNKIARAEHGLTAAGLDITRDANPYTVASMVVPASIHALASGSGMRWRGFDDELRLAQLTAILWAMDDVQVALLGMGGHVTEVKRRDVLVELSSEADDVAERALQVALALGWQPTLAKFDARRLAPRVETIWP